MHKRSWVRIVAAVGLACVLGAGWALGSSRVQEVQQLQPSLEIPLYEGAQVEWEAHLTAQEMAKGLAEWAQELSVLRVAGYTIDGERALDVLNFYDQALSAWRQIFRDQPSEAGGARVFAQGRTYLLIAVSKKYEATDLIVAAGQADEAAVDIPIFEGAELHWELVLTKQDLLEYLKRWVGDLITNPPLAMRMRIWGQPERPRDSMTQVMGWLGILGVEVISRLFQDFSELRIVGSRVDLVMPSQVLDFYDQQFRGWRRNLWIRSEESGSMRVFTRSDAQELRELIALMVMPVGATVINEALTNVIVLRARR